ncbi:MAG: glutamate 5-kinase [Peptostreptococcaceae bacterium]
MREKIKNCRRIVVKIGTSTLTYENGNLNLSRIEKITQVLSDILNSGREVVLVTSGAVGVGASKLNYKEKPTSVREKQACASVGQAILMNIYSKLFGEFGYSVGQILLTKDILDNEIRTKNVSNTFETLINQKVIPIVNENDSISSAEIENIQRFGDNDNLASIVSTLCYADLLIILSDIDGFYDKNPKNNPDAKLIEEVKEITLDMEKSAEGAGSEFGTGGMATKIQAAKIATSNGCNMIIANGENSHLITQILNGENIGTLFVAK